MDISRLPGGLLDAALGFVLGIGCVVVAVVAAAAVSGLTWRETKGIVVRAYAQAARDLAALFRAAATRLRRRR